MAGSVPLTRPCVNHPAYPGGPASACPHCGAEDDIRIPLKPKLNFNRGNGRPAFCAMELSKFTKLWRDAVLKETSSNVKAWLDSVPDSEICSRYGTSTFQVRTQRADSHCVENVPVPASVSWDANSDSDDGFSRSYVYLGDSDAHIGGGGSMDPGADGYPYFYYERINSNSRDRTSSASNATNSGSYGQLPGHHDSLTLRMVSGGTRWLNSPTHDPHTAFRGPMYTANPGFSQSSAGGSAMYAGFLPLASPRDAILRRYIANHPTLASYRTMPSGPARVPSAGPGSTYSIPGTVPSVAPTLRSVNSEGMNPMAPTTPRSNVLLHTVPPVGSGSQTFENLVPVRATHSYNRSGNVPLPDHLRISSSGTTQPTVNGVTSGGPRVFTDAQQTVSERTASSADYSHNGSNVRMASTMAAEPCACCPRPNFVPNTIPSVAPERLTSFSHPRTTPSGTNQSPSAGPGSTYSILSIVPSVAANLRSVNSEGMNPVALAVPRSNALLHTVPPVGSGSQTFGNVVPERATPSYDRSEIDLLLDHVRISGSGSTHPASNGAISGGPRVSTDALQTVSGRTVSSADSSHNGSNVRMAPTSVAEPCACCIRLNSIQNTTPSAAPERITSFSLPRTTPSGTDRSSSAGPGSTYSIPGTVPSVAPTLRSVSSEGMNPVALEMPRSNVLLHTVPPIGSGSQTFGNNIPELVTHSYNHNGIDPLSDHVRISGSGMTHPAADGVTPGGPRVFTDALQTVSGRTTPSADPSQYGSNIRMAYPTAAEACAFCTRPNFVHNTTPSMTPQRMTSFSHPRTTPSGTDRPPSAGPDFTYSIPGTVPSVAPNLRSDNSEGMNPVALAMPRSNVLLHTVPPIGSGSHTFGNLIPERATHSNDRSGIDPLSDHIRISGSGTTHPAEPNFVPNTIPSVAPERMTSFSHPRITHFGTDRSTSASPRSTDSIPATAPLDAPGISNSASSTLRHIATAPSSTTERYIVPGTRGTYSPELVTGSHVLRGLDPLLDDVIMSYSGMMQPAANGVPSGGSSPLTDPLQTSSGGTASGTGLATVYSNSGPYARNMSFNSAPNAAFSTSSRGMDSAPHSAAFGLRPTGSSGQTNSMHESLRYAAPRSTYLTDRVVPPGYAHGPYHTFGNVWAPPPPTMSVPFNPYAWPWTYPTPYHHGSVPPHNHLHENRAPGPPNNQGQAHHASVSQHNHEHMHRLSALSQANGPTHLISAPSQTNGQLHHALISSQTLGQPHRVSIPSQTSGQTQHLPSHNLGQERQIPTSTSTFGQIYDVSAPSQFHEEAQNAFSPSGNHGQAHVSASSHNYELAHHISAPSQVEGQAQRVTAPSQADGGALRASAPSQVEGQAQRVTAPSQADGGALRASAPSQVEGQAQRVTAPSQADEGALRASAPSQADEGALRASAPSQADGQAQRVTAPSQADGGALRASAPSQVEGQAQRVTAPSQADEDEHRTSAPPQAEGQAQRVTAPSQAEGQAQRVTAPSQADGGALRASAPSQADEEAHHSYAPTHTPRINYHSLLYEDIIEHTWHAWHEHQRELVLSRQRATLIWDDFFYNRDPSFLSSIPHFHGPWVEPNDTDEDMVDDSAFTDDSSEYDYDFDSAVVGPASAPQNRPYERTPIHFTTALEQDGRTIRLMLDINGTISTMRYNSDTVRDVILEAQSLVVAMELLDDMQMLPELPDEYRVEEGLFEEEREQFRRDEEEEVPCQDSRWMKSEWFRRRLPLPIYKPWIRPLLRNRTRSRRIDGRLYK